MYIINENSDASPVITLTKIPQICKPSNGTRLLIVAAKNENNIKAMDVNKYFIVFL